MEEYQKATDRLQKVFNKEIVFIVGATRWGTAWLQQFLDAHPEICCKGEGHFTDILFPLLAKAFDEYNTKAEFVGNRLQQSGQAGNAAGFTFEDVHHLMMTAVGLVLDRWAGGGEYKVIAEKTPEHILSLHLLIRAVPKMKIIHVYRDGRDEAISAWDFNNALSQGEFQKRYPNLKDFAATFAGNWVNCITAARRFEKQNPGRSFHIRAENLQGEAEEELAPLLKYLNVDASRDVIKEASVKAWEAAPLDLDSGAWKKKFDDDMTLSFHRECGELLKLLEYGE